MQLASNRVCRHFFSYASSIALAKLLVASFCHSGSRCLIDIARGAYAGVSQPFAQQEQACSALKHDGGVEVSQVMQPSPFEAQLLRQFLKCPGQPHRVDWFTQWIWEHKACVVVGVAHLCPVE